MRQFKNYEVVDFRIDVRRRHR